MQISLFYMRQERITILSLCLCTNQGKCPLEIQVILTSGHHIFVTLYIVLKTGEFLVATTKTNKQIKNKQTKNM